MSKKLAAKASLVQLPPMTQQDSVSTPETRRDPGGSESRAKTAPGSMAVFMASQSAAVKEAEDLREKLKAFDGAKPVRSLDPESVRPSRWANRHEHSYADAAFAELKADIAAAGTNVQPISVRVLPVLNGSTPGEGPVFEVVFGHRRHRACLELGLPVQAMVSELTDLELFEAMERENRARKNLSAWEQGMMYARALDDGLYPSQRRLAEALGVDIALVSKSLTLARLPEAVVEAFPSPLEIQYRWAQPLSEALQKDPEGMIARAKQLKLSGRQAAAADVLAALTVAPHGEVLNGSTVGRRVLTGKTGRTAVVTRDKKGRLRIEVHAGAIDQAGEAQVIGLLESLLNGP